MPHLVIRAGRLERQVYGLTSHTRNLFHQSYNFTPGSTGHNSWMRSPKRASRSRKKANALMRRSFLIGLTTILACVFFNVADVGAHDHDDRLATGAQMLATRDAYVHNCAACHGSEGTGESASVDFTSPEAVARLTRDAMISAVREDHEPEVVAQLDRVLDKNMLPRVIDYIREALMLPAPVADAGVGRRIYARTCSVCHGERGNAASWAQNSLNPPPFDFTSKKAQEISRQRMIHAVTYGVTGTAMMPFATKYDREELAAVIDYIRMTFGRSPQDGEPESPEHGKVAAKQSTTTGGHDHGGHVKDPEAPFPIGLIGDTTAGRIFYEANCSQCHGMKGDGSGPRAYFMRRKPKDFTAPRARAEYDRPNLFEGIAKGVRGTDMPAWSKVLTLQQIADVAEYVYQAFTNAKLSAVPGPDHDHAPQAAPASHTDHMPVKKN